MKTSGNATIPTSLSAALNTAISLTQGVTNDGLIDWDFSLDNDLVQYLALGETVTATYAITVDDRSGASNARATQNVMVVISGNNDTPFVEAADVSGEVIELGTPTGNLTDSGTISFSDLDLLDVHIIDGTITTSAGALGLLTANLTADTTATGTGGVVIWNYSVAASDVEYLQVGESKVETFNITIKDGSGGTVDRLITVTITGSNDAPIVNTEDLMGAVTELVTPTGALTDSGTIGFSDVDLLDVHNTDATITASAGTLGTLTARVASDTTGTGVGGLIAWDYSVPAADIEYLQDSETKVEVFNITLNDGNGGTVNQLISVTITGTNDESVVTSLSSSHDEACDSSVDGMVQIEGTFSDLDLNDSHTVKVDWGDGSALEDVSVDQVNDSFASSHVYATGGLFQITVMLDDGRGEIQTAKTNAATQGVGLVDGVLYVIATDQRDVVRVQRHHGDQVRVSAKFGHLTTEYFLFDQDAVDSIEIIVCEGNDQVRVDRRIEQPTTILGGDGNDFLVGGGGDDIIDGGDGHNFIYGGEGHDTITSGTGNDWITGGGGNDRILSGAGNDKVWAGRGNDIVSAGLGNDWIWGDRGDDLLIGGEGRDKMFGGRGEDLIIAGSTEAQEDTTALDAAMAEWLNTDPTGALDALGDLLDDGDFDVLLGNRGDDMILDGAGDWDVD